MYNYSNINKQKNKAKMLRQNKRYYEAEKIYKKVLSTSNKREKFALHGLAKIKIEQNKFKEAESFLNEAIMLYPGNFKAIFILGKLYLKENKYEEAENLFKECINIDSKNLYARIEMGKLYVKQSKYKKAKKIFKECINIDYKNLHARIELGKVYVKQNKYKEAEKLFKQCLNIDYKNKHAVLELANLYLLQNKYYKAEKILLNSEKNNLILEELAIVYLKTGREKEANEIYKQIYDIDNEKDFFDYNNRILHIRKHEKNNLNKSIQLVFNYDAVELLDYAMNNKKVKKTNYFADIYQIPYKNCGYEGGKDGDGHSLNYLILILFPETEKIITMYPSDKKFDEETL